MSQKKLSHSKHFCILPWVHARINQDAHVYPCCRIEEFYSYGNLSEKNLKSIYNDSAIRDMRQSLQHDQPLASCNDCYRIEALGGESLRTESNRKYAEHFGRVENTDEAGYTSDTNLVFLDLRLSNLCNFRCRTCNPLNSTSWYQDAEEFAGDHTPEKKLAAGVALKLVQENLPTLKKIYFAGGEPLMHPEHYQILQFLIDKQRTDIELEYNTNFSILEFKSAKATELWTKFSTVKIGASLDGVREQGEFLRKGLNWNKIVENFLRLKKEAPHVHFVVAPTLNVMNAFHITEAIAEFYKLGMLNTGDNLSLNLLVQPDYLNLQILNSHERTLLETHYLTFLKEFKTTANPSLYSRVEAELKRALNTLKFAQPQDSDRRRFQAFMLKLDRLRSEKSVLLFPELVDLLLG